MTLTLTALLQARSTQVFDIDSAGRVLAGDDEPGSMQLFEITPDGGRRQLTDLGESCTGRYLPDERLVVVEHDSGGNERDQLSLLDIESGRLDPLVHDPRYIHNLLDVLPGRVVYSTNRRNGVDFDVVVHSVATGEERVLYDGGGWMSTVAVSPDERYVVLGRLSRQPNSTQLLLAETESGRIVEVTAEDEPARSSNPAWRPDSASFVFNTDIGREFTGIAEYTLATKEIRYLETTANDRTGWPARTSKRMLVVDRIDGAETLQLKENGRSTPISFPPHALTTWRTTPIWSPDGKRFAVTVNSATSPDDIYVWSGGELDRLTNSSAELPAGELGTPEIHRIPTPDGERIPCFLYRPRHGSGSVVVIVHGGPESASVQSWNPVLQALLQAGHAVAVPNVRGSTGYGRRWTALDDGRLRLDSVADLAAIHAWLPSAGLDSRRAALYGGSYGGYLVLAGLSMQPGLWAGGVDIVGISSLVTFLQNTSPYRRAYREREYGRIETDRDFLVAASPITHVDAIRAPLLIIHGVNDPRVPLSEAEQVATAVRTRNVECEMYVYPDEGHGLSKLHNKLDAYPKVLEFLGRHLAPEG